MFQKRRFVVILALLSAVILTITGCSSSLIDKAADNAKAFADQKNYDQAATTLHSAERELGSKLGPKELKALSNAYSYVAIKITDDARKIGKEGDYEKAFIKLNSLYEVINLQGTMTLNSEASDGIQSAKEEIVKQCISEALDSKTNPKDAMEFYNLASLGANAMAITPEIQKIFDDARIKITELPAVSIINVCADTNTAAIQDIISNAEEAMRYIESIDKSISKAQSAKVDEAWKVLQKRQTQMEIDTRLAQAEQLNGHQSMENMSGVLKAIHDEPSYNQAITEKQKKRFNAIAVYINKEIKSYETSLWFAKPTAGDEYMIPLFPIQ